MIKSRRLVLLAAVATFALLAAACSDVSNNETSV